MALSTVPAHDSWQGERAVEVLGRRLPGVRIACWSGAIAPARDERRTLPLRLRLEAEQFAVFQTHEDASPMIHRRTTFHGIGR